MEPMSKARRSLLLRQYGVAVLATLLATLLRKLLDPVLDNTAPFTAYYVAIMFTAWYGGLGPSLVALISGAVLADYLFIEPRGSLLIHDLEHQVSLGLYVFVGIVVALLSESLHASRRRTESARAELADANRGLQEEIAERQRAERWLLESEQRFRGYFEQALVGMAMLSADRDWIEVNHSTVPNARLFGTGTDGQSLDRSDSSRRLAWRRRPISNGCWQESPKATSRISGSSARTAKYYTPAFRRSA